MKKLLDLLIQVGEEHLVLLCDIVEGLDRCCKVLFGYFDAFYHRLFGGKFVITTEGELEETLGVLFEIH